MPVQLGEFEMYLMQSLHFVAPAFAQNPALKDAVLIAPDNGRTIPLTKTAQNAVIAKMMNTRREAARFCWLISNLLK